MCGISGIVDLEKNLQNSDKKLFEHNVEEIQHRGPDDFDFGLIVQLMLGLVFKDYRFKI